MTQPHLSGQSTPAAGFIPEQSVRPAVDQPCWMSFSEAHQVTGLSERTLRRYIRNKQIKARKLSKSANGRVQLWITPELVNAVRMTNSQAVDEDEHDDFFNIESEVEAVEVEGTTDSSPTGLSLEEVVRVMTQQFVEKLDQERLLNLQLQKELQDKDAQLKLLPDLQRQLEEQHKAKDFEIAALEKQIAALGDEKDKSQALEAELNVLKAQVAKITEPWWKKWFMPRDVND